MTGEALPLDGRVAAVTGAGRGIGRAIAERLARYGATVLVCDVDESAAVAVAESLVSAGLKASAQLVDVRLPTSTDKVAETLRANYGRLDVLVNNAGLICDSPLHKMTDESWDIVNDVISRGTFNTLRSCAPLIRQMPKDGYHRKVINIASVNGIYGRELSANYCAAKAAVIGLTKALAREWARLKINVNAIAPGYIAGTGLTTPSKDGRTSMREDFMMRVEAAIPIGRGGRPEDVAALATFLATSDSDYITGQVIEIHGGMEIFAL